MPHITTIYVTVKQDWMGDHENLTVKLRVDTKDLLRLVMHSMVHLLVGTSYWVFQHSPTAAAATLQPATGSRSRWPCCRQQGHLLLIGAASCAHLPESLQLVDNYNLFQSCFTGASFGRNGMVHINCPLAETPRSTDPVMQKRCIGLATGHGRQSSTLLPRLRWRLR